MGKMNFSLVKKKPQESPAKIIVPKSSDQAPPDSSSDDSEDEDDFVAELPSGNASLNGSQKGSVQASNNVNMRNNTTSSMR